MIRKERWGLSWVGWTLLLLSAGLSIYMLSLTIYPFLAVTHRVDRDQLVMEGWVHPYAISAAVEEFKSGAYPLIFTTGGPITGTGAYISDSHTTASLGASGLRAAGIPPELIQMVPSHVNVRNRTYSSAIALRRWFRDHNVRVRNINVVTETTHARRTRLLFRKAFGNDIDVGVIAVPSPDYDSKYWWRYSQGVKDVISESFAYIYTIIFFYPASDNDWKTNS